jgi:hypothetical protein
MPDTVNPIDGHADAIEAQHRFKPLQFSGATWVFGHLEPFAFRAQIDENLVVDVVVLFSCHCFTHDRDKDLRRDIPAAELYADGKKTRVLNPQRYQLSKAFLPRLVAELSSRHIRVIGGNKPNYVTIESIDQDGTEICYALFFEVLKDQKRKKRLLLRVQSAYALKSMTEAQKKARKVNLNVLLRAVYEGRTIKA